VKAEVSLKLNINTEEEGLTAMSHIPGDSHYVINIRKREPDQPIDDVLSTTAHELGHFLAAVFKTAAALNDPNNSPVSAAVVQHSYPEKYTKAMLESEEEAWKFAEYVMAGFIKNKEFSLGTYKKRLAEVEEAPEKVKSMGDVLERISELYAKVAPLDAK